MNKENLSDEKLLTLVAEYFESMKTEEQKKMQNIRLNMFRMYWGGRQFKCNDTGEVFTIPEDCYEGDFYKVGNGCVDLGRFNVEKNEPFYYRIGGNVEYKY